MRNSRLFVAFLACAWLHPVSGEMIVLTPTADTSIFSAAADHNLGASLTLAVGGNAKKQPGRGLFAFDVASRIPTGASILSASHAFRVMKDPAAAAESTFTLHRMRVAWTEGTGSGNMGSIAKPGESTWLSRIHPDDFWSVPGGAADIEFVAAPSATVPMQSEGLYSMQSEGIAEDVRQWLANSAANFGWMLKGDLETNQLTARRVAAREDPVNAATLTIEYSVPPRPLIRRVERVGDKLEIEFAAESGNLYEIQVSPTVAGAPAWSSVTNYVVRLFSTNIVFSEILRFDPARFYRVADVGDIDGPQGD
jgi:hypothetical protein